MEGRVRIAINSTQKSLGITKNTYTAVTKCSFFSSQKKTNMKYCPQFAHIPPSFSKLWLFQLHATMFTLHPNNSSKVVKMHWSSNFQTCFVHGVKRKNIERNRFSQKTTWDQKTYFRQFFLLSALFSCAKTTVLASLHILAPFAKNIVQWIKASMHH